MSDWQSRGRVNRVSGIVRQAAGLKSAGGRETSGNLPFKSKYAPQNRESEGIR